MILDSGDYAAGADFEADVAVVGTGAGGAALGSHLAEAGLDVVFVEEGGHHATTSFNPYLTESAPRLYRDGSATVIFGRAPIPYVEGRCVGGSTVVNGGMTWRAPEAVLREWETTLAAPELGPRGLEPWLEMAETRIHASRQHPVSIGNDSRLLRKGADALGWRYDENRRNQDLCVGANNCVQGCPTGAKQSALVSTLPRAFRAGARCLTEVRVERLRIEGGRAVGVEGRSIDRRTRRPGVKVRVRARAVVVAAGAVQTPLLLLRHRLGRPSGELGRNFLCHPNAKVLAVYPHQVRAWEGVSQAGRVNEFEDDGIVMAENFVAPAVLASQLPWHGERAWELMRDYDRLVLTGVLIEDSTTGSVRRGPFGMARARYDITDHDHARFLRGIRHLAELHFAAGAERVILPFGKLHELRSADELPLIDQQKKPSDLELFTVHLMGTCRMGSRASDSVVDLSGQLWDLPGCYVADASLFPSAIRVNPQLTIMALAYHVADRLANGGLAH